MKWSQFGGQTRVVKTSYGEKYGYMNVDGYEPTHRIKRAFSQGSSWSGGGGAPALRPSRAAESIGQRTGRQNKYFKWNIKFSALNKF